MISDIIRGDSRDIQLKFIDKTGSAIDITGSAVWLTIKKNKGDLDADAILQKKVTAHYNPSGGITIISLEPTDTNIAEGVYWYDIQITMASGKVYTVENGKVKIIKDVTLSYTV